MSENDKRPAWEELDYKHDAIVEASAGTGKTYALEHIVAHLVDKKGVDIRNLLLVTFTEKAAGELKERIRKMLVGTAAAKQLDEATICTIHSFCQELLREYPFESGMQMASDVVSSDRVLIERAVQSVITGAKFKEIFGEDFANRMKSCVGAADVDALNNALCESLGKVVASGTGVDKWRAKVLNLRLSALDTICKLMPGIVENKNPGEYVLAHTSDGMTLGLRANDNARYRECFASLDNRLASVKDESDAIENRLKDVVAILNSKMDFKLFKWDGVEYKDKFCKKPGLEPYKQLVDWAKSALKGMGWTFDPRVLGMVYTEYLRLKRRSRAMTFDDMVLETSRAVKDAVTDKDNPAKQAFLKNIRSRYRIALVDEFQDTDDKQWTIFNSLFSSKANIIEEAKTKQGCLIVVGDPKQAIYSFRGADIGTYLTARREIKTGGGQILSLEKMYRSTEEMVNAYNKIFDKPKDQGGNPGWFDKMQANGEPIEYTKVSFPKSEEKPPEDVKDFKYPDSDAAVELLESLPVGTTVDKKTCLALYLENMTKEMFRLHTDEFWKGKMKWSSMCVLVKSHADGDAAQTVLRSKGIPCRIYKEAGLFDSAEAESVLALFDYLTMPRRAGNLAALLLTPFFEVPLSRIEARMSIGDVAFDRLCDRWRTYIAKYEWVKFFESAINDTALGSPHFVEAEGSSRIDGDFMRHRSAIRQIFDLLLVQCGRSRDLTVFSDALRTWRRNDADLGEAGSVRDKESEADAVQIMTIHAAKGLERNAVFVAYGFSSVNMQNTPKEECPAEEMELRRLLYVALTRAKFKLYLPWSKRVDSLDSWETGKKRSPTPLSTFLGRGILYLHGDAETAKTKVKGVDAVPDDDAGHKKKQGPQIEGTASPDLPPPLGMKGWRFKWDSFSSLYHHAAPKAEEVEGAKVTKDELQGNDDGGNDGKNTEENGGEIKESLVPKGALSGTVFHEVMETLCGNDEDKGEVGFKIGKESNFEKLIEETNGKKSPLLEIVRRKLAANGVANRPGKNPNESTAVSIARMAWNTLRTELDFGDGKPFKLCEIEHKYRKAEVNFVLDESLLFANDINRVGALNGSIDLLVRRDNKYYIIDWKTNALEDYEGTTVKVAMDNAGYHDQYKIYTLAAEKWLGDKAVKGAAYLFVRGGEFGESPSGVYVHTMRDGERAEFATGLVKRLGESDNEDETREEEER